MQYELDDEYLEDARRRAYRFQGQWCGTSGSLAADVARLIKERKRMTEAIATLEDANAKLRAAVGERLAGTPSDDPKMVGYEPTGSCCDGGRCHAKPEEPPQEIPTDWILQGQREMDAHKDDVRWTGDSILADKGGDLRPGSREFVGVLDEIKNLHLRKTLDYGVDEDALSNIRESADVVNMPAWAGAILRISDKMHRLKAYFRRGKCEFDGIEDTLKDIASYAAIALVLHREEGKANPV
jgi:hypothetical protein